MAASSTLDGSDLAVDAFGYAASHSMGAVGHDDIRSVP